MGADAYDPLYLRGADCFNKEAFFESHEVWEDLWIRERGPSRQFYKGLIQAAVSLHHLGRGNLRGARTLSARSQACLTPYRPKYLGLDVDAFLLALERCVAGAPAGEPTAVAIDRAKIPRIRLDARPDSPS